MNSCRILVFTYCTFPRYSYLQACSYLTKKIMYINFTTTTITYDYTVKTKWILTSQNLYNVPLVVGYIIRVERVLKLYTRRCQL